MSSQIVTSVSDLDQDTCLLCGQPAAAMVKIADPQTATVHSDDDNVCAVDAQQVAPTLVGTLYFVHDSAE